MTKFRVDGYMSAVLGNKYGQNVSIKSVTAHVLYAQGGIFSRVVDMPAEKAMSAGIHINNDDKRVLSNHIDRLKVTSVLTEALRYARLFGGACIVPIIADGGKLAEPVDYNKIASIEELRVYDMTQVSVEGSVYSDPTQASFGRPEYYRIRTQNADFVVHESRVVAVAGDHLPELMRHSKIYWQGRNVVDRPYKAILDWQEALSNARQILNRKQQPIYSMTGLATLIGAGLEEQVQQRINAVDAARGILNTVAIDSEDKYELKDMGLSGLSDVLGEFKQAVSVESGIPITVLFGVSSAGLNATGEGDLRSYHEVAANERLRATPALEKIIALIAAQKGVAAQDDWSIEWPKLYVPTAKESAEMDKLEADTDMTVAKAIETAVGTGALSEQEATDYLRQLGLFGLVDSASSGEGAKYAAKAQA